jgi:hypothetical protein
MRRPTPVILLAALLLSIAARQGEAIQLRYKFAKGDIARTNPPSPRRRCACK